MLNYVKFFKNDEYCSLMPNSVGECRILLNNIEKSRILMNDVEFYLLNNVEFCR